MKKYILLFILCFVSIAFSAQTALSNTENYIYTKTCLDASCTKRSEVVKYYDGSGRPRQIIGIKESPAGKDIVIPIVYDESGKNTRNYFPIPQPNSAGGAMYTQNNGLVPYPVDDATNFYSGEKIYSEQVIENSPLSRPQQKTQPGNDWSSKPVTFGYAANTTTDKVRSFKAVSVWENGATKSSLTDIGFYANAQLYKNVVKDEDGNETISFKNTRGLVVLRRKVIDIDDYVDTYNVYDKYDQLVFVLPPLAATVSDIATNEIKQNNLCYQYKYDGRNRIVEQKFPSKGWEQFVYNKRRQIILYRHANLKNGINGFIDNEAWVFTKYDKFGRPVYSGISRDGTSRQALQHALDGQLVDFETRGGSTTASGMTIEYTNTVYPIAISKILSVHYYDTYPSGSPAIPTLILGQSILTDIQSLPENTKGLQTASYVKNIDDDSWTKDYIWYDLKKRKVGTQSINHLGGYTQAESLLDYSGIPQKINTYHVRQIGEPGVTVKERFVYDNQNRLKQHYHQVDSKPEQLLAENTYNEVSQIINKKVGGNLQSIDYTYNVRGWLTDINKDQMSVADLGGKLFSYKIKYNQKNGITNPDQVLFQGKNVVPKFDGNIAEVDWRAIETIGANPSLIPKRYGYAYNKLNRLSAGYYQNPDNPYSKENTEVLDYDVNGNISKLYRTSRMEYGSNTATVIDDLKYIYNSGGNQLTSINDISTNFAGYEGGGNPITYDLNGNMKDMVDKGISSINYNYLDLASQIKMQVDIENINIDIKYSAGGTKLRKENTTIISGYNGDTVTKKITDYLDGFQYFSSKNITVPGGSEEFFSNLESSRAMERQAFSPDQARNPPPPLKTPDLQFFPTAEGFYDYQKDQYIYHYRDHLGNIRVSFARNSEGVLEITDKNDFYPYGMNHLKTGLSFFGAGNYKNYKFGSKELQETGFYDFDARFYIPDIGRFGTHDPLSSSTLDPYGYAYDNPLFFTDTSGTRADPINGEEGDGGPEVPPNSLGGVNNPHPIQEVVINAPLRAIASNPGSVMPNYCTLCYSGNGTSSGISLPPLPPASMIPDSFYKPVLNNGSAMMLGGAGDPFGIWEVMGIILASSDDPNVKMAVLPLLVITKNGDDALKILAAEKGAVFGSSVSNNYKATFFKANTELKGTVVVHHAVEQQVLKRYPGLVTDSEMHSLENLRGIPKAINSDVHLSQIRKTWNKFYKENSDPTKQQLLDQATLIDNQFGTQFTPKLK